MSNKITLHYNDVNSEAIHRSSVRGVYIDIGANHGSWLSGIDIRAERIYAFEPEPDNRKILRERTIERTNVVIVGSALSDKMGKTKLWRSSNPGGHSIAEKVGTTGSWGHDTDKWLMVDTTTLDEYVLTNNVKNIVCVKIDVEGAEEYVVRGALKTFDKFSPVIAIETHQTVNLEALFNLFSSIKYNIYNNEGNLQDKLSFDTGYLCLRKKDFTGN